MNRTIKDATVVNWTPQALRVYQQALEGRMIGRLSARARPVARSPAGLPFPRLFATHPRRTWVAELDEANLSLVAPDRMLYAGTSIVVPTSLLAAT